MNRSSINVREEARYLSTTPPWVLLTKQSRKAELYSGEFVADNIWQSLMNSGIRGEDFYRYTFLIIKPEGLARRLTVKIINYLNRLGMSVVHAMPAPIGRNAGHHIWRFQWNAATYDRVALTTFGNSLAPSLLLLLKDTMSSTIPASVRMWAQKGSAHESRRRPDQLRSEIGMHNRMLGFVHTPDEPADIIRELGILYDDIQQETIVDRLISHERSDSAQAEALRIEKNCLCHSVSPEEVIERLVLSRPYFAKLWEKRSIKTWSLHELSQSFGLRQHKCDDWDFLTVAAELIEHDRPGVKPILDAKAVDEVKVLWEGAE
ncbi:nucleoside-diphosphate kinase [Vreelandella neptunia]|uniref:Nucleoside diphosphate kinase-like domain-containing protein n=1 Tax=Vreelandella neptunia TaxID=115551 RepID=A0ABS9SCI5_9GAMM|nr:nucleoside-diphosphate kinase [Halomonas neptunia]MCH4813836.1 hypothetical protein [Halomonas neptunia]